MEERKKIIKKRIKKVVKPSIKKINDNNISKFIEPHKSLDFVTGVKVEHPYQFFFDVIFTIGAIYGFITMTLQLLFWIKSVILSFTF